MLIAMPQLVTRIDAELLAAVDRLVTDGVVHSRSEAVRLGLEQLVDRAQRAKIAAAILEGYRRIPQNDEELRRAAAGVKALVTEEPW
jgi:Arc/MetJ-type ribon-helix-helix transcriptional regulator